MKIRMRYDNQFQTLELNQKEIEQLCVSLSLDPCTADEKVIQEALDIQYNRPEYNNWHKFYRHIDNDPHLKCLNGHRGYVVDDGESLGEGFFTQYPDFNSSMPDFEYEDLCKYIRTILKPKQADLLISICIDGVSVSEYAEKEGVSQPAITYRLDVAKKNFKKHF